MFTTLIQIEKLRPTFQFGDYEMVEWFTVTKSKGYCCISSGLRHADGVTKSPYQYEHFEVGKSADKKAIAHFNEFWKDFTTEISFHI